MKIGRLLIASLVLIVLAGLLYLSDHRKLSGETAKVSADTSPQILKLDGTVITGLEIKAKDAVPILLAKGGSGDWRMVGPKPFRADQNVVLSMVSTLASLHANRVVEEKTTDLKAYGLAPPAAEVDVTEKDNKTQKLFLGDDTPAGGNAYAMLAGDPRVFTIASYSKLNLDKNLDALRNKKLFDFGFTEPDKVELHNGPKTYVLTRSGQDWLSDGKKMDPESVRVLVSKLRGLAATQFVDSGFTRPVIDATVTSSDGKRVEKVLISQSGNRYIARRSDEPDLYELAPNSVDDLQKAAEAIKPAAQGK